MDGVGGYAGEGDWGRERLRGRGLEGRGLGGRE